MKYGALTRSGSTLVAGALAAAMLVAAAGTARAEDTAQIAITIKDHKFDPPEVHAPAGRPIAFRVKNLGSIAAEFESDALHVEKVIAPGAEAVVRVRPQQAGRYTFFDDFHRETQGLLIVP